MAFRRAPRCPGMPACAQRHIKRRGPAPPPHCHNDPSRVEAIVAVAAGIAPLPHRGAPASTRASPYTMRAMPARPAASSHMRQAREVDTSTQPDRSRVRSRRAASRIASISACAVGSAARDHSARRSADDQLATQHHRAIGLVAGTQSLVAQRLGAAHRQLQGVTLAACSGADGQRQQDRDQAVAARRAGLARQHVPIVLPAPCRLRAKAVVRPAGAPYPPGRDAQHRAEAVASATSPSRRTENPT